MDIEHLAQVGLVTTGQIPGYRQAHVPTGGEHATVALAQLFGGKPATQRIIDVRIGTGLVQQKVATGKTPHDIGNLLEERFGLVLAIPPGPRGVVLDPVQAKLADDVGRAIAIVLVEIKNAYTPHRALAVQHQRSDHQAVEGAVAATLLVAGVMEPGNRCHGTAFDQGHARRLEHRTAGPRQTGRHFRQMVAKTVGTLE